MASKELGRPLGENSQSEEENEEMVDLADDPSYQENDLNVSMLS